MQEAANSNPVRYDVDGFDTVTEALRTLLNSFPGLDEGEEISFSKLSENSGISMFPTSGAIIQTERISVIGKVHQVCLYPFYVIYRAGGLSQSRRAGIKEWLDNLGKWLERQPIIVSDTEYQLSGYPDLTGNRQFLSIDRQTPAYLDSTNENQSENWMISITARYQNIFYRR